MAQIAFDVYTDGSAASRKILLVSPDWSIDNLIKEISTRFKNGADPNLLHLVCAGKPLVCGTGKYIRDFEFLNHGARIDIVQQVKGGSRLTSLAGYIQLTKEPCCVTYDDDPNEMRAKMPCGCAISALEMKRMCDTVLASGGYLFRCPGCDKEWEYFLVKHVLSSCMTDDQLAATSQRVSSNYFGRNPDIQQCPMCHTYSQRNFALNWPSGRHRVVCLTCTMANGGTEVEFCWGCLKPWGGSEHSTCDGAVSKLRYLTNCETKKVGVVDGCPAVRGCPKCGTLLWHKEACKHMKCPPPCGYDFCFVCLKPQNEAKQWQCGSYNSPCNVAPRQTSLPN